MYIGHTIINVTVPATIGALTNHTDAAKDAEEGAYLTRAIPGGRDRAREVISVATGIYDRLIEKGTE
jgi:methylthioribose-1-phosphate isomerase